ncbi:hypothetical protein EMIT0P44_560011 [Pseudomonas sp. IT-P44]
MANRGDFRWFRFGCRVVAGPTLTGRAFVTRTLAKRNLMWEPACCGRRSDDSDLKDAIASKPAPTQSVFRR